MRRLAVSLALVASLLGGAAAYEPTSGASFNARGANPASTYAFTALYAPTSLTATASGHNVGLSWSAGTNGNGYAVLGVANGSSSDCSSATFASLGTAASTSYIDTGRYTPQGTWFCYQVKTTYGPWASVNGNPTTAAQLGVVAVSVAAANGGTTGKLDTGDTITITFNQAITQSTGPGSSDTVCSVNGATVVLAATKTTGSCGAGETSDLGTLTGGSSSKNARWAATYAWSNGNTTLKIKLGTLITGSASTMSGTWKFNPVTTTTMLLSTTGLFHICDTNSGGGACIPTVTGGF